MPAAQPSSPADRPPTLWTNPITLFGLLLVAGGLLLLITFWLFMLISPEHGQNQYLSIIGFMILPGIMVTGLVLCPIGMLLRRRRLRHGPIHQISVRHAYMFLGITFFLILPVLGISGYTGYHYTESAEFCGSCHSVMDPQFTRYQVSPHARVTCAGCHIGPGASPFVKSKLSGLRQVYRTATGTFPRPVPPAITELRPARETCEVCHWPQQFFGSQLKPLARYTPNEANTRHDYQVLIKVGGADKSLGRAEGIHMHMLDHIEYLATDERLDVIPWVRYRYPDGRKVVFRSDGQPGSAPPAGQVRTFDCIDCHNLIGHAFLSPQRAVDNALEVKHLDPRLPYIKREAVRALAQPYETTPEGLEKIAASLRSFYANASLSGGKPPTAQVEAAIQAVQTIYKANFFPEMKVNWQTYPDHIGHMESPGCFRCHDGRHFNEDGKPITTQCVACHTFLNRVPNTDMISEGQFIHEMKLHDLWERLGPHENMLCTDCHDGGLMAWGSSEALTPEACGDCHSSGRWLKIREELRRRPATQPAGAAPEA